MSHSLPTPSSTPNMTAPEPENTNTSLAEDSMTSEENILHSPIQMYHFG